MKQLDKNLRSRLKLNFQWSRIFSRPMSHFGLLTYSPGSLNPVSISLILRSDCGALIHELPILFVTCLSKREEGQNNLPSFITYAYINFPVRFSPISGKPEYYVYEIPFSIATLSYLYRLVIDQIPKIALHWLAERHGRKFGEIAAQAATSGECELTKFAFGCKSFVVHLRALKPYEGILPASRSWRYVIDPGKMKGLVDLSKCKWISKAYYVSKKWHHRELNLLMLVSWI